MAPVDSSPAPLPSNGNFEFICSLKANNLVPVHKYKSRVTGLTVLIAEVEGPVVNGYFCLATEAHDDDGLPHTLEHLIFLGSERYPYKGVLDLLANRCLASGTNAWTDTDHTCYTMTTAGSEGFLSLMPIYLDHILYPTLTDSGFITEVHHITADGEDGGVVYCEMQGRENTGESLTHLALLRAAYPGKCGYKSETGGILKNLRESTDNIKVRSYHKQFYRPENLTLIITGQVKPEEVFKSLRILEEKIVSKGERGEFTRPWQDTVPPLEEAQDIEVPYPCDDEDNGMVYVGWRGPSAVKELYKMEACSILLKYLTDTSVSPLQKEFVEIEDPYASRVSYSLSENSECILYLIFDSVPLDKLNSIRAHLLTFLSKINGFDMTRLKAVIHRHILEVLSQLENSPHDAIAYMLIGDMLYGDSKEALAQRLNAVADFKLMEKEPESYWLELLQHYIVSAPSITVRGKPSQEKQEQMTAEELKRIEEQKLQLSETGLKNVADKLLQAMEQNDRPPPNEMLTSVPIPTTDSIVFHSIKSFSSGSDQQHPKFSLIDTPVYMHLDHVHTNFVYMFVLLDTSGISLELRSYLPLLLDSLLELPVKRGDVLVKYEDVVAELEGDTVSASAKIGLEASDRFSCGPYSHTASLMLQLEPAKYERCIVWIRELLYQTQINVERLRVIASKIINDVSQAKRKGHKVVGDLMKGICFNNESNFHVASMLRQHKFLTGLMEKIDTEEGSKQILSEMEALRAALTDPTRMVVHMAADVDRLSELYEKPASLWTQMLPPGQSAKNKPLAVTPDWTMLNPPYDSPFPSCIVGLGCVESSYLSQTTPCIKDFNDPDLAPLLVFLQYLTQLEGPMWRQIRGQGLAYHYHIMPRPNEGLLHMGFYRATNCVGAYKEAKSIVEAHMIDDVKWDQTLFEAARSSLIFEIIEREKSVGDVVTQSLLSYFKKVGPDYNRSLVQLISNVTPADLTRVGSKYVSPLFDSTIAKTTIVCNPSKAAEIALGLQDTKHQLTIFSSLEESFLSQ